MGCCAIVLVGMAFWKEAVGAYHLRRLQRDSRRLLDLVTQREGAPERLAARRFIGTPVGKQELLRLYLDEVERSIPEVAERLSGLVRAPDGSKAEFWVGRRRAYISYKQHIRTAEVRASPPEVENTIRRLRTVQEILVEIGYSDHVLAASHPFLRFGVIPSARSGLGGWEPGFHRQIFGSTIEHVMVVRKVEPD